MVPLSAYLAVAAILFTIGVFGVLFKRNSIIVLLSIELMLNAANINLVAFSKFGIYPDTAGQIFSLFVIAVAAVEAAVGLAILILYFRNRGTININEMDIMKR
ncbi:MAG: NADH-quinone oxidoreductase subunit NuoK [Anaerovoracaceae bacterium]|jgi:NADH-quinone oxidoreductase subunit K